MECHFGDKDSCTDMCRHYKTCIWSANHLKIKKEPNKEPDRVHFNYSEIPNKSYDKLVIETALNNIKHN